MLSHFERLCEFMSGNPLTVSCHLAIFGGHWSGGSGYIKYLICPASSQDHVIEQSSEGMNWSSSWSVATLSSLVAIHVVVV